MTTLQRKRVNNSFFFSVTTTILLLLFLVVKPVYAGPAQYQQCNSSSTCQIGEFFYDDNYSPVATAACTITSRYPDGSLFINAASMTANSDGWYGYTVTTGTTEGIYRTNVCCVYQTETTCLDKSFEVKAPSGSSLTAADIWSYSNRSLSSYGTLISDIWNYSDRSLTTFGSLVSNIWSNSTRSVTDSNGNVITSTGSSSNTTNHNYATNNYISNNYSSAYTNFEKTLNTILAKVNSDQQLLERLVNKPVVNTFIDEGAKFDPKVLNQKIDSTKQSSTRLYTAAHYLNSQLTDLADQYDSLSISAINEQVNDLENHIKNTEQKDLLEVGDWLKNNWGTSLSIEISDQIRTISNKLEILKQDLVDKGKTANNLTTAKSLVNHASRLVSLVGEVGIASEGTLKAFVRDLELNTKTYDENHTTLTNLLTKWQGQPSTQTTDTIAQITTKLLEVSYIPAPNQLLVSLDSDTTKTLKNRIYSLLGLIDLNRRYLIATDTKALRSLWLEEGSVVFKAVATNPSKTIAQEVEVKFYLPPEVKREQIIKSDPVLTIQLDPAENALYATATVTLEPKETQTYAIEVEDIWQFSQEELASIKKQAGTLLEPLKNTAFFAQGTTLRSDIELSLDKIALAQSEAVTPESRIHAYREAQLELVSIKQKTEGLKELISQSSATGSIFGFVGGVQSLAVWGLVIIIAAGFGMMVFYLRSIRGLAPVSEYSPSTTKATSPNKLQAIRAAKDLKSQLHLISKTSSKLLVIAALSTMLLSTIYVKTRSNTRPLISPLSDVSR